MIKTIIDYIKFKINIKGDIQTTSLLFIGALILGAILLVMLIYFLFSTSQSKLDKLFG